MHGFKPAYVVDLALLLDFLHVVVLNYDAPILQLRVIASYRARLCAQ